MFFLFKFHLPIDTRPPPPPQKKHKKDKSFGVHIGYAGSGSFSFNFTCMHYQRRDFNLTRDLSAISIFNQQVKDH